MFKGTKLLAASTSAVEWYKSHVHTSFLSEVIKILMTIVCQLNVNGYRDIPEVVKENANKL